MSVTEATRPLPDPEGTDGTASAAPAVNITKLLGEAASKSGLLWIRLPSGATHPAWHVWHDDGDPRGTGPAAYVISGIGEQPLPWLPEQVDLIFRSKDSGGRLLTITAQVLEITPESDEWEAAAAVVRPERLNFAEPAEDVDLRWRTGCVIHRLTPLGRPSEQPGAYAARSGSRVATPTKAVTTGWRPWHWRGRPSTRRGTVPRHDG